LGLGEAREEKGGQKGGKRIFGGGQTKAKFFQALRCVWTSVEGPCWVVNTDKYSRGVIRSGRRWSLGMEEGIVLTWARNGVVGGSKIEWGGDQTKAVLKHTILKRN